MKLGYKAGIAAAVIGTLGLIALPQAAFSHDRRGDYEYRYNHHGYGPFHRGYGNYYRGHDLDRLLERFDTDKDKKLSQDELNEARKQMLAKHDTDKNGELSLDEFKMLWLEFMNQRMVRMFQRIDRDGDAKITESEFLKPFADAVEQMDRNDDGVLSSEDDGYAMRRHKRHEQ